MALETNPLLAQVRDMVKAAGIDNFRFDEGVLVMCGARYSIEKCGCTDPDCNGLRLRKEAGVNNAPSKNIAMQ